MAKYLLLIYGQESDAPATPEQWDWMMQAHGQFAQAVDQQGGKILGGEALQPTATATSVRDDGQAVTDGPFVDTKEALGGFYLIEAADLDQALAFAKLCPAPGGGVELRPIMDTSGARRARNTGIPGRRPRFGGAGRGAPSPVGIRAGGGGAPGR
jgi:hypothetical protein